MGLSLAVIAFFFTGCKPSPLDGCAMDVQFTGAGSIAEIREKFSTATFAHRYPDPAEAFSIYQVTNGSSEFAFVQAGNWPRGFGGCNLYCYEKARGRPETWVLRALAPLNDYWYTNDTSMSVSFVADGQYLKAIYRGAVVFSLTSLSNQNGLQLQTSH